MMLTDLPEAVAKSGLPMELVEGWRTRGHGQFAAIHSVVLHHTATPLVTPGNYPSLRIVRDGRSDLPGPLSQLGLGRDGTVYVIAAGVAWHAGSTFFAAQDNYHAIGIEAEHPGVGAWTPAQYDAYVRLVAALSEHYAIPLPNVQGHKEIAKPLGRKIDPTFDMNRFRADVDAYQRNRRKRAERLRKLALAQKRKAKWQGWVKRANKNIARLKRLTK